MNFAVKMVLAPILLVVGVILVFFLLTLSSEMVAYNEPTESEIAARVMVQIRRDWRSGAPDFGLPIVRGTGERQYVVGVVVRNGPRGERVYYQAEVDMPCHRRDAPECYRISDLIAVSQGVFDSLFAR